MKFHLGKVIKKSTGRLKFTKNSNRSGIAVQWNGGGGGGGLRTQQQIKLNTGAKEIQKVNPGGPDNSKSIRSLPKLLLISFSLLTKTIVCFLICRCTLVV